MTLFSVPSDGVAQTSDDCYTPKWVFDAMGLRFDLDVAAPPGGPWHVPCDRYYTAADDGLAQPWDGLVWCNPPYSSFLPWAERWLAHPAGVLMGYELPQVRWKRAADRLRVHPRGRQELPASTVHLRCVPWRRDATGRTSRGGFAVWRCSVRKGGVMIACHPERTSEIRQNGGPTKDGPRADRANDPLLPGASPRWIGA